MAVGDPPIRKPVVAPDYDKCWKPHPTNPELEVNQLDGKLRTKERPIWDFVWTIPSTPESEDPNAIDYY